MVIWSTYLTRFSVVTTPVIRSSIIPIQITVTFRETPHTDEIIGSLVHILIENWMIVVQYWPLTTTTDRTAAVELLVQLQVNNNLLKLVSYNFHLFTWRLNLFLIFLHEQIIFQQQMIMIVKWQYFDCFENDMYKIVININK